MPETFYERLGVAEDASMAEIEDAYREAIKQVHPDVSDELDAAERTKRLNKAKRVLTDETERARYDRLGHEAYTSDVPDSPTGDSSGVDTSRTASRGPTGDSTSETGRRERRRRRSGRSTGASYWGVDDDRDAGGTTSGSTGDSGEETRSDAGRSSRDPTSPGAGRWARSHVDRGRAAHSTGPSQGTTGPPWQSQGRTTGGSSSGVDSPSARRQAAAGSTDGPNADWSWNGWEQTRSWAVREGGPAGGGLHPSRLFPAEQSVVLLAATFLLYPIFIFTVLFPPFPLLARATVAVCTLLMFAYLLSVPEVAIAVYGVWSLLVPLVIFLIPGLSIFSLAGVVGLSATWVPLGLSVLTFSVVRP